MSGEHNCPSASNESIWRRWSVGAIIHKLEVHRRK